jgi:hypothetical protein
VPGRRAIRRGIGEAFDGVSAIDDTRLVDEAISEAGSDGGVIHAPSRFLWC